MNVRFAEGDIHCFDGVFKVYVRNRRCGLEKCTRDDPRDCRERGLLHHRMCWSCRWYSDSTMWAPLVESVKRRNNKQTPVINPIKEEKNNMNHSKYIKNVLHTYVRNTSCDHVVGSFGCSWSKLDCREAHRMLCLRCSHRTAEDMWKKYSESKMKKPATKKFAPKKKLTRPAKKKPTQKSIKTEVTLPATKLSITAKGSALNGPSWETCSTWTNTITAERRDSTGTNRVDDRLAWADDDVIVLYIEDSYGADPEVRFSAKELKVFFEALFT